MIVHKTNACSIHDVIKATDQSWEEMNLQNFLSLSLQWSGQWLGAVDEQ